MKTYSNPRSRSQLGKDLRIDTFFFRASRGVLLLVTLLLVGMSPGRVAAQVPVEAARVRSIQIADTGLNVVVAVPAGQRRITLETLSLIHI